MQWRSKWLQRLHCQRSWVVASINCSNARRSVKLLKDIILKVNASRYFLVLHDSRYSSYPGTFGSYHIQRYQ
jgi:hypothetical protein